MTTFSRRRGPSPILVRHALHHVYAATAIVLMITGVFLTLPDLRARLIGGYGREILDLHLWIERSEKCHRDGQASDGNRITAVHDAIETNIRRDDAFRRNILARRTQIFS